MRTRVEEAGVTYCFSIRKEQCVGCKNASFSTV